MYNGIKHDQIPGDNLQAFSEPWLALEGGWWWVDGRAGPGLGCGCAVATGAAPLPSLPAAVLTVP